MSTAQDFGDIKRLTIEALQAAAIPGVKAVEPFAGQIEDAIEGRTARFPLLTVLFAGEYFEQIDGPSHHETNDFSVGIYAHSLRGPAELSDQAEGLVRAVKQCLVNARLATNVEPVEPARVRLVYADAVTQVYEFAFRVALDQRYQWPE